MTRCRGYDLLLMPTLPMTATPLPAADAPIPEIIQRAFEMLPNTAAVRLHPSSGDEHPVRHGGWPAGRDDAGRKTLDEATIYRAAAAFERGVDWKTIKA